MLFFFQEHSENTQIQVNILPFSEILTSYHYQNNCIYVKIRQSRIIGGTQIISNKRNIHLFDKIIHFSMQFSAVLNIFIVKIELNSTFTNDLKRK